MGSVFKNLHIEKDMTNTTTLLHESIPLTGSIVSGTYADNNIKDYAHGMMQSVYDYPYLSSSANHVFDITCAYHSDSALSKSSGVDATQEKKINLYNSMAQVLAGHDHTGSIHKFDQDGDHLAGGTKLNEVYFMCFSRLLSKDEIKKQSFELKVLTGSTPSAPSDVKTISDYGAGTSYKVNSPAGEYGILYSGSAATAGTGVGLIYYQAGIAVLTASVFDGEFGEPTATYDTASVNAVLSGTTIQNFADGLRNRIQNVQFNNTTELNSTIYYCRAHHNEFNYSTNPTYLTESQIRVKKEAGNPPVSYFTTVGLYGADNALLAVAKLSEPIKKTEDNEVTLRVRLDY
jgi:hypothetical protein